MRYDVIIFVAILVGMVALLWFTRYKEPPVKDDFRLPVGDIKVPKLPAATVKKLTRGWVGKNGKVHHAGDKRKR